MGCFHSVSPGSSFSSILGCVRPEGGSKDTRWGVPHTDGSHSPQGASSVQVQRERVGQRLWRGLGGGLSCSGVDGASDSISSSTAGQRAAGSSPGPHPAHSGRHGPSPRGANTLLSLGEFCCFHQRCPRASAPAGAGDTGRSPYTHTSPRGQGQEEGGSRTTRIIQIY